MTSNTTAARIFAMLTPRKRTYGTWREQVLNGVLRSSTVLGAFSLIFGCIDALRTRSIIELICYVAIYAALIYITFAGSLSFSLRSGVLICLPYMLAIVNLYEQGLTGDGAIFLFMFICLATILLDRSIGILAFGISLLTIAATAWALVSRTIDISSTQADSTSAASWVGSSTVFLLLGVILIATLSYLIHTLEASLIDAQQERTFVSTVLDTAGALVMVLDPNGRIVRFNRTCEQTAGRSFEEMRGQHFRSLPFAPNDLASFQLIIDQLRSNLSVREHEHHWITPDGEERLITWSNTVLFDGEGALAYLICTGIDITERRQAEIERTQLQEAIIQAQASTLQDMSTPLIPISESAVVMPLVGAIDRARSQQVMETLLRGIEARQSRIAILDITGVAVVDTEVAHGLLQVAQATRLLGSQVVLTGIRPEVAQSIVGLGVDLNEIVTRSTLQSGIAYALAQERSVGA